jgi:putative ABC transport system substrate-binding protein
VTRAGVLRDPANPSGPAQFGIIQAAAPSFRHRDLIIALAARHRLPTIYYERSFVAAGGLVSYGADYVDQYRRAAGYGAALRPW